MRDVELVQLLRLVLVLVLVDDEDDDDEDDVNDENDDENEVESWRAAVSLRSPSSSGTTDSSFSRCRCCWHDDITGPLSSVIVNNDLGRCKGCGAIVMLRSVSFDEEFCCGWMLIIVFVFYERVVRVVLGVSIVELLTLKHGKILY